MPHLVCPPAPDLPICLVTEQVRAAHDYLVAAAKKSVQDHRRHPIDSWGRATKRDKVVLPEGPRPELVDPKTGEHSLAEIMNQCATMERLLDALVWARGEFGESEEKEASGRWLVATCHPTTSSAKGKDHDHDLVLAGPDDAWAYFEVSDVASTKDGNGKELKDVRLLLPGLEDPAKAEIDDGKIRRFLVVSEEFGECLETTSSQSKNRNVRFHYTRMMTSGSTAIFEVKSGPRPGCPGN